jgi:hypothetical protein
MPRAVRLGLMVDRFSWVEPAVETRRFAADSRELF